MVGLFFFIRASIKDRTEQLEFLAMEPEESIFERLQTYFEQRSYRIIDVDGVNSIVTYEGFVPPSGFIAVFLSLLAALGLVCIALVLTLLYPSIGFITLAIALFAPLAGLFLLAQSWQSGKSHLTNHPENANYRRTQPVNYSNRPSG
jgi:hypothetical protein